MFLNGYRLLDMCWLGAGPFTAQLLGDLGFDVIKITEVSKGSGRRGGQDSGVLLMAHNAAQLSQFRFGMRNARSIALNLKTPEGLQVFRRLVEKADAIQEGFRPGVADRLGVGYEAARKINPGIVYASLTGYGQTGPYREKAGHDINFESIAGFIGLNGRAGGGPVIPGALVADFAAGGMSAAIHILSALLRRERTRQGAYCDVSLTDAVFEANSMAIGAYLGSGEEIRRGESFYSGMWPWYDLYTTKDGKYVSVGAVEPYFYENLCRTLGREDLLDQQWAADQREEIRREFAKTFKSKTQAEWVALFDGVNACVTPVYSPGEAVADPQMRARNMVTELDHPVHEKAQMVGSMFKLDGTPLEARTWMLWPGQHTEEILEEHGFSSSEVADLRENGVVA
ncbi:MAG: CaiB/BaiF CoA transferase family protein [Candidatus Binatia bacterium]